MDPRDADRCLKIINNAIHEVYNHTPTTRTIHDLCSKASRLVQNNFGQKLYSGIVSTMTSHLKEMKTSIEKVWPDVQLFLEELIKKWTEHDNAFQILRPVVMCMDGTCTPGTHEAHVQELEATLWVDNVIYSSNIRGNLRLAVAEMVLEEREGEVIDMDLMKNLAKMLMDFGHSVYQEMFEQPFIEISTTLYTAESEDLMNNYDCAYYLKTTEKRLNEEIERVSDYLNVKHDLAAESITKIINVLEDIMIVTHMDTLVHSGLVTMIEHDKNDDLARMYNLFRRVPDGLNKIFDVMNSHFVKAVAELATHPERIEDPVDCVQQILAKKEKRDKIINLAFNDDLNIKKLLEISMIEKLKTECSHQFTSELEAMLSDALRTE